MFLAMMILAIFVVVFLACYMAPHVAYMLGGLILIKRAIEAPPEYHYRHCKTCDYTYLVSGDYPGNDPGCPACGAPSWETETTGLLHKYIKAKWQDIESPPRITGFAANMPLYAPPDEKLLRQAPAHIATIIRQVHARSIREQVHRMPMRVTPVPPEFDHISRHSAQYEPTLEADD